MNAPLRVLLLEDDPNDAELVRELLSDQFSLEITRAETRDRFVAAVETGHLDLILADYRLPSFDGLSALELAMQRCPGVPFIFVSGTIGEDLAIEAIKRGATDYVLKTRMSRLVLSVQRALREARERAEREAAQEALRRSEIYLAEAQRMAHVGWWERDFATGHVSLSEETCRIFGMQPVDLPEWHGRWLELIHPEDRQRAGKAALAALDREGPPYDIEYRVVRLDRMVRFVHSQGYVVWDQDGHPLRQFGVMQDVTELRQAERELLASEMRFRSFADHATDAFFLLDDNSIVIDANRRACAGLGYSRSELIGKHRREFDEDLDDAAAADIKRRLLADEAVTFETRHRRKDGTTFPVEVRVGYFDQDGMRYACVARDITERKLAEQALRASEERFRLLVDHASDAFFLYDEDGTVLDVNRQACESLGYDRDELIGKPAYDYGPDLTPDLLDRIRARLRSGKIVTYDGRHRRKDGTVFPVEIRIRPLWHEGRLMAVSLDRDISQRKRAEHELRLSEERFRTLVQFSFDVYWETDAQHRFTRQEFAEGLTDAPAPGSEIGKTRWEVPHLEPDAEAWRKHRETLDAHLPFRDFELARPAADGGKRYVSVSGIPVFDEAGCFIGYRGVGRHITERKKAEDALRRSEAYLAEAQKLSHSGAYAFDRRQSLFWSDELYHIWGFDPQLGIPPREVWLQRVHPDDRDRIRCELQDALRRRRDFTIEFRITLPDGTLKHLRSTGHPRHDAAGSLVEVVGTTIDVTDRKRAQAEHEQLRQLEADLAHLNRLSMMGELTAALAHEILHPIATARNNARAGMRLLEMNPPDLAEVMDALACVVRDADRAKDIVARVRDQIQKAPPRKERFDINAAINEVIGMAQDAIDRNRVAVSTQLANPMPSVWGDRVQLQQVVLNLVLNAVEAMSALEERRRRLSISTQPSDTNAILVEVSDSGPGLNADQLETVFKAFYTTKPGGIGMGLSICRSIINAHGGQLWAEANAGQGASFRFTLPQARQVHES